MITTTSDPYKTISDQSQEQVTISHVHIREHWKGVNQFPSPEGKTKRNSTTTVQGKYFCIF